MSLVSNSPILSKGLVHEQEFKKREQKRLSMKIMTQDSTNECNENENQKDNVQDKENMPFNNDELEKMKRRRRQSRVFSQRRKSLTPTSKKREYVKDMYSTIIKMSSENKINQKNSWSLHLIDHMDDILEHKREQDEMDTYNFQKASCTLDASVKIYSYRVDDTWNSSFKILENLTRNDSGKETQVKEVQKDTSKKLCVANTLESNLNNINTKAFDVNYQVDPLFHKMSQTFDEGGAKGLLLANLGVDNGCQIVFDSSDTIISMDLEEPISLKEVSNQSVDVFKLSQRIKSLCGSTKELEICPKLEVFRRGIEENTGYKRPRYSIGQSFVDHKENSNDLPENDEKHDDHCSSDDEIDSYVDDGFDYADEDCEKQEMDLQVCFGEDKDYSEPTNQPKSSAVSEEALINSLSQVEAALRESIQNGESDYSYFDVQKLKNWAGPDHWKFKGFRKTQSSNLNANDPTTKPSKKEQQIVDFMNNNTDLDTYFELSKSISSINQTDATIKRLQNNAESLVLPLDIHYNIEDLLALFVKPKMKLHLSNVDKRAIHVQMHPNNIEMDANDIDGDNIMYIDNNDMDSIDEDDNEVNFMDDDFKVSGLLEAERIVEKVDIKYETVAKRVDVNKLKENIWDELEHLIVIDDSTNETNEASKLEINVSIEEDQSVKEKEVNDVTFEGVMNNVSEKVPSNVTVPFYFICMLHLANERGLKLVGQSDLSNFQILKDDSTDMA